MPFCFYEAIGKFKVSYSYKLPDGTWAFRLTASILDKAAASRIRTEAIDRANVLNGMPLKAAKPKRCSGATSPGTTACLQTAKIVRPIAR